MEIINISDYKEIRFSTGVALGNFDGLHLGHKKLIETMVEESKKKKIKPALLLFNNHTKKTIDNNQPRLLTSNEQKIKIVENLGVEIIYTMDFDENIMKLSAEEFITNIIMKKINSKLLVVGFDYRFGHKASGDSKLLKEIGKKYNINVTVLDPIYNDGIVIGSTIIRNLIMDGKILEANNILGRPYSVIGKVVPGKNRGHTLGFPTANIRIDNKYIIPKTGVYVSNTTINGKKYISATNIGNNPTFNDKELKIETYILNFDGNIYGKNIEVEFLDYLREDIKFENKNELINQMKTDIELIKNKY